MTEAVEIYASSEAVRAMLTHGDFGKLPPDQQQEVLVRYHEHVGLDPVINAFNLIPGRNGVMTIYANKRAAAALAAKYGISVEILAEGEDDKGNYKVRVRAHAPDGRFRDDIGVTEVGGLKGQAYGNKVMHAVTKGSNRAILGLKGMGVLDETEVEDSFPRVENPAAKAALPQASEPTMTLQEEAEHILRQQQRLYDVAGRLGYPPDRVQQISAERYNGLPVEKLSAPQLDEWVKRAQDALRKKESEEAAAIAGQEVTE